VSLDVNKKEETEAINCTKSKLGICACGQPGLSVADGTDESNTVERHMYNHGIELRSLERPNLGY
jgi:hypothetical protein